LKITRLLLLPFVFLLAAAFGCDENNNMMSPPGEGDPPAASKCEGVNLDDCPCDYDMIAKDVKCWLLVGVIDSTIIYVADGSSCTLSLKEDGEREPPELKVDNGFCGVIFNTLENSICSETNIFVIHEDLTPDETAACQCSLEKYTKELIQAGFPVSEDEASGSLAAEEISCPAE